MKWKGTRYSVLVRRISADQMAVVSHHAPARDDLQPQLSCSLLCPWVLRSRLKPDYPCPDSCRLIGHGSRSLCRHADINNLNARFARNRIEVGVGAKPRHLFRNRMDRDDGETLATQIKANGSAGTLQFGRHPDNGDHPRRRKQFSDMVVALAIFPPLALAQYLTHSWFLRSVIDTNLCHPACQDWDCTSRRRSFRSRTSQLSMFNSQLPRE